MQLHQVLVSASPGDAITNEAFEIRSILKDFGSSDIYARHVHAELASEVLPLTAFHERVGGGSEQDVIVFHASIGNAEVAEFLEGRPEKLLLIYHNIAPAESFRPYEPEYAALLELGREQLDEIRGRVSLALADSAFNAAELEAIGYQDVQVSPLIVDVERLLSIEPHAPTMEHFAKRVDGPVILFVGQQLPHKRPDLLIQAYHVLNTYLVQDAHLFLVGPGRLPRYEQLLQHYVEELSLPRAAVIGEVTLEELVAFYRRADLFVTMSEHEGFCVPVLEAMAFEIPIVARGFGAIPETVGDAGVVLPPEADLLIAAEAFAEVLQNDELRKQLIVKGRERLRSFDPEASRETFRSLLSSFVEA